MSILTIIIIIMRFRDVLLEGGSAVDAAIATLFCEGVSCIQSMGVGGGHFMTIYDRETRQVFTLNARETAPGAAHEDMFEGDSELSSKGTSYF
jgi:gamma-glutamyltranspeptidase/glutathione hydrolase/leukotriene-C4 hydrolase